MRGARLVPGSRDRVRAREGSPGGPASAVRRAAFSSPLRVFLVPVLSVVALTAATDALVIPLVFQALSRAGVSFLDRGDLEAILAAFILACVLGLAFAVWKLRLNQLSLLRGSRAEQQRALFLAEASQLFASSLDLEQTLRTVVRKATEVLGDVCMIQLVEPESPTLRLAAAFDRRGESGDSIAALMREHPVPIGQGLAGHVVRTGDPVLVANYRSSPFALPEYASIFDVGGALAVPLRVGGRVTGALVCGSHAAGRGPDVHDLRLAELLADRAAIAIEHARLYQGLETLVEEQTAELREANRQLLEAERAKAISELAAMVAHEIRNPLNVVKTATYFIKGQVRGQNPRVDRHLDLLDRHVDSAAQIIQDLIDYGAFPEPDFALVSMGDIARAVVDEVNVPHHVELEVRIDPEQCPVRCDSGQIRRAVKHLLLNGIQSVDDRGKVAFLVEQQGERVVVECRDTGRGVPESDRRRIFDPLFSTKVKGSGMGLTLTRRIMEEHGGGIEFETEPGSGSTFRIWLPVAKPSPVPEACAAETTDPAGATGAADGRGGLAAGESQR
jgi:signal transduction histidine kinase